MTPENSEKARNRLVKRQQFQQQQQQKQEQQQLLLQQQQQQLNQLDMKKIMSLIDENYEINKVPYVPQLRQHEIAPNLYTNTIATELQQQEHDYGLLQSVFNGSNSAAEENILWDGFWNLEDVQGHFGAFASSKPTMHSNNLLAPFC